MLEFGRLIAGAAGLGAFFGRPPSGHSEEAKGEGRPLLPSPVFDWMKDTSLRCRFATTPTRIAAGLDACVGRVYCEDKRTGAVVKRGTQICAVEGKKCPDLAACADPKNEIRVVAIYAAEPADPKPDDLLRVDIHGRECRYDTDVPQAVWIELKNKKEMLGICATPIICKNSNEKLPSVAVCEAITPPKNPKLAAKENQEREPFPVLECPRVNSCIKNAIESYPSE